MNKSNLFMDVNDKYSTECNGCGIDIPPGAAHISGIRSFPGFSHRSLCFDCVIVANSYRIVDEVQHDMNRQGYSDALVPEPAKEKP